LTSLSPTALFGGRRTKVWLLLYGVGAGVTLAYLAWSAVDGGAVRREHHDWPMIAVFYGAATLGWPLLWLILALLVTGLVRGPICCG